MDTIKLRQDFLNYFRKNGHKFLPPSKIYNDDPTLFFVNSGMCQLKDYFLGIKEPKAGFSKLMNSQICIRAGGKHNDLDDVGFDSYHLTGFEMCGNWSLNQANKSEAIELAFNFLTNICNLNKEQMYVTYFEGDNQVKADLETKDLWKKFISESRIIPGSFKDNFWMMAENGPCGVCTEIHYDLIGNRFVPELVNKSDSHVIEIWNIVFIQYNRQADGYNLLNNSFVDTGMGLERLSMILQKRDSIYQTDVFKYLMGYAQALTGADFYTDKYGPEQQKDASYRIFADHMRTCVIALNQGVVFDCTKRGFILRKIFRRMATHLYLYLNNKVIEPKMDKKIMSCMISQILDYFLEFKHDADAVQSKLVKEEKLFLGKLRHFKRTYDNMHKKGVQKQEIFSRLKEEVGIDNIFITHMNDLTFNY